MTYMRYITLFLAAVSGIESRSISITQPSLRMLMPESYVENMPPLSHLPPHPPPPPMYPPPSQSQSPYTNKLIGADPATWSPSTNKHTEPMLVESKDYVVEAFAEPSVESKNINDIFTPIKDCINNTKIDLYIKEQDIDFSDIINLNALVLFQYIKDIIHSTRLPTQLVH